MVKKREIQPASCALLNGSPITGLDPTLTAGMPPLLGAYNKIMYVLRVLRVRPAAIFLSEYGLLWDTKVIPDFLLIPHMSLVFSKNKP